MKRSNSSAACDLQIVRIARSKIISPQASNRGYDGSMKSTDKVMAEPPSIAVPDGVVQARAAFLRDFQALFADRKTRGKYVLYHKDTCVAVSKDYFHLVREVTARNIPENESLITLVTVASELVERALAEESELP
jgi:hypothetical protein